MSQPTEDELKRKLLWQGLFLSLGGDPALVGGATRVPRPLSDEEEANVEICQGCGVGFYYRGGNQLCWKCKKR